MKVCDLLNATETGTGLIEAHNSAAIPYAAFAKRVRQAMAVLLQHTHLGDRIGICGAGSVDWLAWDLAILSAGRVTVPVESSDWASLGQLGLALLVTDSAAPCPATRLTGFSIQEDAALYTGPAVELVLSAPAAVKRTSGSTGSGRLYEAPIGHLEHMMSGTQELFEFTREDTVLVALPLTVFLQRLVIYVALFASAKLVFTSPAFMPRALRHHCPTIMIGVPYMLQSMQQVYAAGDRKARFADAWGGRMRSLWTGSAPISKELLYEYSSSGIPVHQGYGMTETGMIAKNSPEANKIGSVGRLFPHTEARVSDDGEIQVRVPFAPASIDKGIPVQWFCTGDLGFFDDEGYLFLTGRKKDVVVLDNGQKVLPGAWETNLCTLSGVAHVCMVKHGEAQVALIVELSGQASDTKGIEGAIRSQFAGSRIPLGKVRLVEPGTFAANDALTPNGKLRRDRAQALIEL